jgi:hypothetical protein
VSAARLLRKGLADGEHGGRARRVVVGAHMHAPGLFFGGERVAVIAAAQMIVVRAEDYPRLVRRRAAGRRQIGGDIVSRPLLAFDDRVDAHLDARECETGHVRVA